MPTFNLPALRRATPLLGLLVGAAALAEKLFGALLLALLGLAAALLSGVGRLGRRTAEQAALGFRSMKRLRLRRETRRYSVLIGDVRWALLDLSRTGFCAQGDIDAAPQRAEAVIFRDDAPMLRGEARQIWRGDRDAKYRFLRVDR